MIPTKSKISLKQYLQKKPQELGYKVFLRCGISGIIYDFEIYQGKTPHSTSPSVLGVTGDLVMRLCNTLLKHQNYKVYCDNFFTSLPLIRELRNQGILLLGTIRSNRMQGASKVLRSDKDMKKDGRRSCDWRTDVSTNITVLKWYDNSIVHLATCFVSPEYGEDGHRSKINIWKLIAHLWCMNTIALWEALICATCSYLCTEWS